MICVSRYGAEDYVVILMLAGCSKEVDTSRVLSSQTFMSLSLVLMNNQLRVNHCSNHAMASEKYVQKSRIVDGFWYNGTLSYRGGMTVLS